MTSDPLIAYLHSIDDSNELARALHEVGAAGNPAPEFEFLLRKAIIGCGHHSRSLRSMFSMKGKSSREHIARTRRFNRIKASHPALEQLTGGRSQHDQQFPARLDEAVEMDASQLTTRPPDKLPINEFAAGVERRSAWYDEFLGSLQSHLYEQQLEIFPHIYGPHRRPPAGQCRASGLNPFYEKPTALRSLQSSTLMAVDALKVFNGISFAMWRHGQVMNTHVIVVWSMIPGIDEASAATVMGQYLNRAQKWMEVGRGPRQRRSECPRLGEKLHYVWVHENAPERGFHSHILMNLPPTSRNAFDTWSRACLARLCKTRFHENAFRVVQSSTLIEHKQVTRVWSWFRYLMKQLDPAEMLSVRDAGGRLSFVRMREVIRPWRMRESLPISLQKRIGVSHSIDVGAQNAEHFVSKLNSADFAGLYQGREFADRRAADLWKSEPRPPWHSEFK